MGVVGGVAERGVDALLEPVGQGVFQQFRLGVHLVPRHAERAGEESLQQPVATHHAERSAFSAGGELK